MKKLLIAFTILPFVLCACSKTEEPAAAATGGATTTTGSGPKTPAKPADQLVGTWKVDVANTTIPVTSEKDKTEEANMRVEVKADGTYATTGTDKPDAGKWELKDHTVTFTATPPAHAPPPMTLSDDGSKMTVTMPGDKPMTMVMIKE